MSVLDALERETVRARAFLDGLSDDDWARPTRCPPMTVLEMGAHTCRAVLRLADMLDAGPVDDEPQKDATTYYRFDRAALSPGVVERARADATSYGGGSGLLALWDDRVGATLARVRSAPDAVFASPLGTIRLEAYLRTRVVEVTVHHLDLRDALGAAPAPDPAAIEVTGDLLRGMLGTDLRPGVDDVRFALIGTGRAPLDPAERATLGPLADLFPLLA